MLEDSQLTSFYINLTRRQREVLKLASDGYSNPDIAKKLCIEPCVVAGHLTNIYGELTALGYLDDQYRPKRYALIRLFIGFFERHPEFHQP